jgi:hypothetical protein
MAERWIGTRTVRSVLPVKAWSSWSASIRHAIGVANPSLALKPARLRAEALPPSR